MPRITLCPLNVTPGAIDANTDRAIAAFNAAEQRGSDLVVFPECTIPGYAAKDLFTRPAFIVENSLALERFARETRNGAAALIGFAHHHNGPGSGVANAAALCRAGKVEAIYHKRLLPTYDVFDDDRFFDPGREPLVVNVAGIPIGISICEDLWTDDRFAAKRYLCDPLAELVQAGAALIVNLSASPYQLEKRDNRRGLLSATARRLGVPVLYVNEVGGCDDVIFDGGAFAFCREGERRAELPPFIEQPLDVTALYDGRTVTLLDGELYHEPQTMEDLRQALVLGIRDYFGKCGVKQALLGLSGGIDSALVAALAVQALGAENVRGVTMPTRFSSEGSVEDSLRLAENLGMRCDTISIEAMFATALAKLAPHFEDTTFGIAEENMQARLRGMTLMTLANKTGAVVLATSNKSEMAVGYTTLYGDMCGGLAPIADLLKTLVYRLSRHLNEHAGRELIPAAIIEKVPSAELRPEQKDSDTLPPYDVLDEILFRHINLAEDEAAIIAAGSEPAIVRRVLRMVANAEYKRRQAPVVLKVRGRAFGYGWRMPIARGFYR